MSPRGAREKPGEETVMEVEEEGQREENGWGENGWGENGWGENGWGENGWGENGWGENGWGENGWGENGWGENGWGENGWGENGCGENGWGEGEWEEEEREEGWEEGEWEQQQQQEQSQDPEAAAAALEEKRQRVTAWLKKIYGDEPVPQYEVNTRTVDILYELAECNTARYRDVSLLIKDMKQKATEYDAEAKYLQGVLVETLGISPTTLYSEGTDHLSILVESAMILETKDTSLASFFCAINDMTSELYETELENREMEQELISLRKKLTRALMLEKQLKEDLKKVKELLEVETAKADRQFQNLEFLKRKSVDLKLEIKDAEEKLAATGLDQTLTHESLVKLSKELAEVQDEIVPLKKELDSYLDLTPNSSLADVKIQGVKRELEAVEAEFSRQIDMLTLELPKSGKLFP